MKKVTKKDLATLVKRLNEITGSPVKPYTKFNTDDNANIGHYQIVGDYSGVQLERIVKKSGVVEMISLHGMSTKKQLFKFVEAWLAGFKEGQKI